MSISHHLTDETLQDYAAGSLSESMETLIACHLTVCQHCRARSAMADNIGGTILDVEETSSVTTPVSDILQRAKLTQTASHYAIKKKPIADDVPRPLGRLLPSRLEELDWKRMAPGIKQHNLTDKHRREGAFKLLHLSPGVVLSAHSHNDRELTYVVRGSYQDEIGRFKAGDIADLDGHDVHQPVVDTSDPCIALIATHSPVRFQGMFGKIIQPFVGI